MLYRIKKYFSRPYAISGFHDENLAKAYLEKTSNDALHAEFERKEMLRIIENVTSGHIVIAGSGPGLYAEDLIDKKNIITCIDNSKAMHELAYHKLGDQVSYLTHDLNEMIPLPKDSFDLVISPLTIQYISDLQQLYAEFNRILKPGGRAVVSTIHPFINKGEKYLQKEKIYQEFSEFKIKIQAYRRPLHHLTDAILQNGFTLRGIYEPLPHESLKQKNKNVYESLSTQPLFIFFEFEKRD